MHSDICLHLYQIIEYYGIFNIYLIRHIGYCRICGFQLSSIFFRLSNADLIELSSSRFISYRVLSLMLSKTTHISTQFVNRLLLNEFLLQLLMGN